MKVDDDPDGMDERYKINHSVLARNVVAAKRRAGSRHHPPIEHEREMRMEPRAGDINSTVDYAARLIERQAAVVQAARGLLTGWLDQTSACVTGAEPLRRALAELDREFAPDPLVHA